jgi:hypothetical protein
VRGDVPPYAIVAGNPARVLRYRFDAEIVERILGVAWWTWPVDRILAHEAAICGGDVAALEGRRAVIRGAAAPVCRSCCRFCCSAHIRPAPERVDASGLGIPP